LSGLMSRPTIHIGAPFISPYYVPWTSPTCPEWTAPTWTGTTITLNAGGQS
jgi:hypothetical protein